MTTIDLCPCCGSNSFSAHLQVKDFTVSHETFQIIRCNKCAFLITSPRPDDSQLSKYYQATNYISHNKESTGFLNTIYRTARHFTIQWKHKLLQKYTDTKQRKVLIDYGCGTGDFLHYCARKGWSGYGIEPSEKARQQIPAPTHQKVYPTIQHTALPPAQAITLWHVLEHVPNLHQTLDLLKRNLDRTGTIFIALPNPQSHNAARYAQTWAAYDVPRHLWHFTPKTMAQILGKHGLTIADTLPMSLDAYYVSLLSEQYLGHKKTTAVLQAIRQGFKSNSAAQNTGQYASLIYIVRP
jgi:2-polyprenyl-3-methyl-5-hydroxy-6-metoxy-1,4-benzoquinol methylase